MNVVWARHARNRLDEIHDFISQDAPSRALGFCERLIDAADQLVLHPLRRPLLPEDPAYRQLTVEEYRLVYRVADTMVFVLTIVGPGMIYEEAV